MTLEIGMLAYPAITQLDLTAPYEIFHRIPGAKVRIVWKTTEPVRTEEGFALLPDTTLDACPPLDVVFVPGGFGQVQLMTDDAVLSFLRRQAANARYVTSVCTGALVLGAAGLLADHAATTHWAYVDLLPLFGARHEKARVVRDRKLITAGGVTAGIDFALVVASELAGEAVARRIQLGLEYDPAPPFGRGSPDVADPALVEEIRTRLRQRTEATAARA
ncbi:MAG: DJ-1/PfpI family protein [Deltaproteobacteria bacterium]|nr:DJ-1/PfpI family protein [Deltaproteobacteria bacterium]